VYLTRATWDRSPGFPPCAQPAGDRTAGRACPSKCTAELADCTDPPSPSRDDDLPLRLAKAYTSSGRSDAVASSSCSPAGTRGAAQGHGRSHLSEPCARTGRTRVGRGTVWCGNEPVPPAATELIIGIDWNGAAATCHVALELFTYELQPLHVSVDAIVTI
jgi:hypothetical protein